MDEQEKQKHRTISKIRSLMYRLKLEFMKAGMSEDEAYKKAYQVAILKYPPDKL